MNSSVVMIVVVLAILAGAAAYFLRPEPEIRERAEIRGQPPVDQATTEKLTREVAALRESIERLEAAMRTSQPAAVPRTESNEAPSPERDRPEKPAAVPLLHQPDPVRRASFTEMAKLSENDLPRAMRFWTLQQVIAQCGMPDEVVTNYNEIWLMYKTQKADWTIVMTDGIVLCTRKQDN